MNRFTGLRFCIVPLLCVFAISLRAAEPNSLSADELADGWILLFDGESTFGWEAGGKANWSVADGIVSASEGDGTPSLLATTGEFGDYILQADFRTAADTNSGIFLRTSLWPSDPTSDCYELNIAPAGNPFPTGSLVKRQKTTGVTVKPGAWNSFEVSAVGGRLAVKLNGKQLIDYTDSRPIARGRIGLQHNHGKIEFRNIKLKPLGLKPIFNGKDLTGWTVEKPDDKNRNGKSVYSVSPEGWLNVKNGPGAIESQARFGDFVLQLEAFSDGDGLNSGVFFRSIPGEHWNGYECQINNVYRDGDRTKPADCGTGGFYRRQNARRVVANDREWFQITLVATGNHMAAWINGLQVSDWTDLRPPHKNPRNGSRKAAGTLQIQGHDPTTNLSFRNLRAAEMAASPSAMK
ncbi:MAG: DUF1080 domain-containing protein [Pirellulales bacterium]|nr:DUF1080 domain-containing protein [Pirellulales bacterium]